MRIIDKLGRLVKWLVKWVYVTIIAFFALIVLAFIIGILLT